MKKIEYLEVRPTMVGLSGGNHSIQKAIRFFTKSPWSHSFCVVDWPELSVSSMETTAFNAGCFPLSRKLDEPDWVAMFDVVAGEVDKLLSLRKVYRERIGEMYGHLSYLWFMYRWVARMFGYEPTSVWKWASKGITCTEMTVKYLAGIDDKFARLFKYRDHNAWAPEELFQLMISHPEHFKFRGWLKEPPIEIMESVFELV